MPSCGLVTTGGWGWGRVPGLSWGPWASSVSKYYCVVKGGRQKEGQAQQRLKGSKKGARTLLAWMCMQNFAESRVGTHQLRAAEQRPRGKNFCLRSLLYFSVYSKQPPLPTPASRSRSTKHIEAAFLAACLQLQPPTQTASPLHTAQPVCALGWGSVTGTCSVQGSRSRQGLWRELVFYIAMGQGLEQPWGTSCLDHHLTLNFRVPNSLSPVR